VRKSERERERECVCGGRGEASSRRQERWIIRLSEDGMMMVGQRNTARDWYKRTWRTHTLAHTTVTTWGRLSEHWAYRRDRDDHQEV